jgi:hypothetical protein
MPQMAAEGRRAFMARKMLDCERAVKSGMCHWHIPMVD